MAELTFTLHEATSVLHERARVRLANAVAVARRAEARLGKPFKRPAAELAAAQHARQALRRVEACTKTLEFWNRAMARVLDRETSP